MAGSERTGPESPEGRVLLEAVVRTDHGQFDLVWADGEFGFGGDYRREFAGQVNGLVGAASGTSLYVNLAHVYGGSAVRIVVLEQAPDVDNATWEDIVEVSIEMPEGARTFWLSYFDDRDSKDNPLDLAPGRYRVRVSARGRDQAAAYPGRPETIDTYLIQLWPAPGSLTPSSRSPARTLGIGTRRTGEVAGPRRDLSAG